MRCVQCLRTIALARHAKKIALAGCMLSRTTHGSPNTAAEPGLSPDIEKSRAALSPRLEARPATGDGVYGRFDGDFDVSLELGAEYARNLDPNLGASLWYFWTVGLHAAHSFDIADRPDTIQRSALGLALRPLFLVRWSSDLESGPALLDLTLDSLALGLAAHWPHEAPARAGPQAFASLGVPLFGTAAGPWLELRGFYRFPNSAENGAAIFAGLSWHALFNSGLQR